MWAKCGQAARFETHIGLYEGFVTLHGCADLRFAALQRPPSFGESAPRCSNSKSLLQPSAAPSICERRCQLGVQTAVRQLADIRFVRVGCKRDCRAPLILHPSSSSLTLLSGRARCRLTFLYLGRSLPQWLHKIHSNQSPSFCQTSQNPSGHRVNISACVSILMAACSNTFEPQNHRIHPSVHLQHPGRASLIF